MVCNALDPANRFAWSSRARRPFLKSAHFNADYWIAKVESNRRRDADTDAALAEAKWTTLRF